MLKNKYHSDGTVTYWSVYHQQWIRHADHVPDRELAAMSPRVRKRVIKHFINHTLNANLYCPVFWDDVLGCWLYDEKRLGVDEKCYTGDNRIDPSDL